MHELQSRQNESLIKAKCFNCINAVFAMFQEKSDESTDITGVLCRSEDLLRETMTNITVMKNKVKILEKL